MPDKCQEKNPGWQAKGSNKRTNHTIPEAQNKTKAPQAWGGYGKAFLSECYPEHGGRLHQISRTAQAVYHVLCSHAGAEGLAYPSVETIAQGIGVTRRPVQTALKQLVDHGLIAVVQPGGGRNRPTKYRITPPHNHAPTVNHSINRAGNNTVSDIKDAGYSAVSPKNSATHDIPIDTKGAIHGPKPCTSEPKNAHLLAPEQLKTNNNTDACNSELRECLKEIGVKGKKLDELATTPGLTVQEIIRVCTKAQSKSKDNPIGLLVRMLEDGERGDPPTLKEIKQQEHLVKAERCRHAAVELLEDLKADATPNSLEAAHAWLAEVKPPYVLATAKDAVPGLWVVNAKGQRVWFVTPYEDDRVLIKCYQHDVANTRRGEQFARQFATRATKTDQDKS